MTESYNIKFDDNYYIVFEWWGGGGYLLNRTISICLYDTKNILVLEDKNLIINEKNLLHYKELRNIKIHRDISTKNYLIYSNFIYDFLKNTVKITGYDDIKSRLLSYDRNLKINELIK